MTVIGHIDSDCFYVSAERARRPELRSVPVGVLGNQGACVIAKSYELKACGVPTGMAIWEALPLCPDAVFVKRDFEWYEVISRRMLELVRTLSPSVEYYSIDEQFFDASYLEQSFRTGLEEAVRLLQEQVRDVVGIPVSIGVAPTKTYAKLISNSVKPYGYGVVTDPKEALERFAETPVDAITGIAKRSKLKLQAYGITNCQHFAEADRRLIRKLLTKTGEELWWELHGTQTKPILTKRPANKIVARGGSVGNASADEDKLVGWVARNTERLIEALDHHQFNTDELTLTLRAKTGLSYSARQKLPQSTAQFSLLFEAAVGLFYSLWAHGRLVSHLHLIAGKLTYREAVQQSLFHAPTEKEQRIAAAKAAVNKKVGRFAVRSGATLPLYDLYHDEASDYETCDIYGTTCF